MCTLTHFAMLPDERVTASMIMQAADMDNPPTPTWSHRTPRFRVVPAGNAFFHIKETSTGLVRGFRENHNEACALARWLESKIELHGDACLR